MNNENEFNAWLTKDIRKLGTEIKAIKLSDRFRSGVSDWLIFHKGLTIAVESKAVKELPKRGRALKHPVTGPQLSFFESMRLAGICGFVIVAELDIRAMTVIPYPSVPRSGNFTVEDILHAAHFKNVCPSTPCLKFNFTETRDMLNQMFFGNALWNSLF